MNADWYYVLDDRGEPRAVDDIVVWAEWWETADRTVADTTLAGPPPIRISTVFLGLNQQWHDGPPILWESMLFGGPLDGWQRRYYTRAAAERGHAAIVAACRRATVTADRDTLHATLEAIPRG